MKPPLFLVSHSYSSLIFWFTALVISINILTSVCEDDDQYNNCNKAFSCGSSVTNLKYPFWGVNREKYCGDPDLKLSCQESVPKLTIQPNTYRILSWNDATQTLTVARDDYWNSICVTEYNNDTFDGTPFRYENDQIVNVTLLYNCNPSASPPSTWLRSTCGNDQNVYYGLQPLNSVVSCTSVVTISVHQTQAALVSSGKINEALDDGLSLKWTGNYEECNRCTGSGGECGIDGGTFQCFCKDGPHTTSCHNSTSSSSSSSSIRRKIIIGVSASFFGAGLFFLLILCCHNRRQSYAKKRNFGHRRKSVNHSVEVFMQSYGSLVPKRYSYSEIKKITNSFLNKLGEGGYGVVYKASLPDSRLVAVKVLSESNGTGEEFINEVASISRTSHVNIVTLVGFMI